MYGNNQQQSLPVPADQPIHNLIQFDPQYSPAPYPNYNIEPAIQNVLPLISTVSANEVQNNARRSALRMFAFNLYGQSGFNNDAFRQLVCGLADYVAFEAARGNVMDLVQTVVNLAPNYVALVTANLARQYPALQQMLDQQTFNHTTNLVGQFDQLAMAIQNFRRGGMQGGMSSGMGGGSMGGSGLGMGATMGSGAGMRGSNMGGGGMMGDQGSALFSTPSSGNASVQGQTSDMRGRRYAQQADFKTTRVGEDSQDTAGVRIERAGGRAMPEPVQPQAAQPQKPAEPFEVLADESSYKWKPSKSQLYPLAYQPRSTLLYHKVMPDGTVIEILKQRKQGRMDYEKHCLVKSFGSTLQSADARAAQQRLEDMKRSLEVRSEAEPFLDEASRALLKRRVFDDMVMFEPNFESAWLVTMMGRQSKMDDAGKMPDIYQRRCVVATPVYTRENEIDLIKELASCTTYSQARIKMLDMQTRMSPELWYTCERRLTDAVNRTLSLRMCIEKPNIDSFTEDVVDLIASLRKRGEMFATAFEASVTEVLSSEFDLLDVDMEETLSFITENYTSNYLNDEKFKAAAPKLTYLSSNVTLTLLNCLASELETELSTTHGMMVGSNTPFLNELAMQIVNEVGNNSATRHFIRTLDGRIIELGEGLLGNDVYLMKITR